MAGLERADLVRALDRSGLDPQAKEKIERELGNVFRDMRKQREAEEKQRKIEEEMERRAAAEAAAEEEARQRKQDSDEDWAKFSHQLKAGLHLYGEGEEPDLGPNILSALDLNLHKTLPNGQKEEFSVQARWHDTEDVSHAAFRFCSINMLHAHNEVSNVAAHLRQRLSVPEAMPPEHPGIYLLCG